MRRINQLCARFLWHGKEQSAKGARVSWKEICFPKSEGGLGIKDIESWNNACILQNIWAIISKAGSIWIAWLNEYVLKGRSIWLIPFSPSCGWSWRKLLKPRQIASEFVERKNGEERWKISGRYKAAAVWRSIRPRQEKVTWHKLVWCLVNVPKHCFISWMAVRNRLPTKDRLREWGILMDNRCVLCQSMEETRNHLFFGCPYSQGIWTKILRLCNLDRRVMSWANELRSAEKRTKGKAMISLLLRVA